MLKVHFIAIGGSAMHNLAIALHKKGVQVTGSDDEIFEPSRSRLENHGLLPSTMGWNANRIDKELDAVILGMHARGDNPELLQAKLLGIQVFSYPEFLYEQSKDKIRIVIGGSHGKTSITAMLLHVAGKLSLDIDYMVGAQLEGFDCMVKISNQAKFMILEGDEYLSSPIDRRPKFHLYRPTIALISGIAWDHVNVFPTFENYQEQFDIFCSLIEKGGSLIFNKEDTSVKALGEKYSTVLQVKPYGTPTFTPESNGSILEWQKKKYHLSIFGKHNLQNAMGAMFVAEKMGVSNEQFLTSLEDFKGAGKRLQKVSESSEFIMFKDFAHSPSKLKATTNAVKHQFPKRRLIACMELHTFSSLQKDFLPLYQHCMEDADEAIVYFNPEVVKHKKLPELAISDVEKGFGGTVRVLNKTEDVLSFLRAQNWNQSTLLMMSSGNFDGIEFEELGNELVLSVS
jgi:UDP-N-acetylmuramate: L-alanyl-gamma-D-glutamyl-meso-diaminopimelate ligase